MKSISIQEGVSVITCTNKPLLRKNVFENYNNQRWPRKEHIIILNHDSMQVSEWEKFAEDHAEVSVYKVPEQESLGACLNVAVKKAKYPYIAKFDDDDYYGPFYLSEAMAAFQKSGASVVGKHTYFMYLAEKEQLMIRFPLKANKWTTYIAGGTIIAKRTVCEKIAFADRPLGVDDQFLRDCRRKNFKIYATSQFNYTYIRRDNQYHTWKPDEEYLIQTSKIVGITTDFRKYANADPNSDVKENR